MKRAYKFSSAGSILLAPHQQLSSPTHYKGCEDKSASWRILVSIGLAFGLLQIALALLLSVSPRLSAQKGRHDEAKRAIAVMHGVSVEDRNTSLESEYHELDPSCGGGPR